MTGHDLHCVERLREFEHVAFCECGHQSTGPNPDTARKRHDIHVAIQEARAALREGSNDDHAR